MPGYVWKGDPPAETRGRPATFISELCGTYAGYMQHYRRKEKRCEPCLKARSQYSAENKARLRERRISNNSIPAPTAQDISIKLEG